MKKCNYKHIQLKNCNILSSGYNNNNLQELQKYRQDLVNKKTSISDLKKDIWGHVIGILGDT